ncbi:MAG TPA: hypothetical protein VF069_26065 [Streptosporangiaceae bacterium]
MEEVSMSLSACAPAHPAVVSREPNHLDVFITGNNGHVYTSAWTEGMEWNGLGGWFDIGGVFPAGAPVSAVSRAPDHLDLFVIGNDGRVYTSAWTEGMGWNGLGGWFDIGGVFPVGAPVSVVSRAPNHLDLFVTGNDGRVYTSAWTEGGQWTGLNGWFNIGGVFPVGTPVSAVSRAPNHLDLFVIGNDGHVYTSAWTEGMEWNGLRGWFDIGGVFPAANPTPAVARHSKQLDVFVLGNDGHVYTSAWTDGGQWTGLNGWFNIGGVFAPYAPALATYSLTLETVEINNTRSRDDDTDYASFTVAVGTAPPQTRIDSMGDVDNGTYRLGLNFIVPVPRYSPLVMNYQVVNAGHKSEAEVDALLTKIADQLAASGAQAAASAVGSGIGAIAGAAIGTGVVPVLGTALGALAGWIVAEIGGVLFADCDGPVASEQVPFAPTQIWQETRGGAALRRRTHHPGVDSASGCGSNSDYYVTWSVSAVAAH